MNRKELAKILRQTAGKLSATAETSIGFGIIILWLDSAAKHIRRRYKQHTEEQIREYGTKDPAIFKYELEDMPTAEFMEFLKLAYPFNVAFERKLFKYVCNHLEVAEQLLPLFRFKFNTDIIFKSAVNYRDASLSVKLLEEWGPWEGARILVGREWDPKDLLDAWKAKINKRIIVHVIPLEIDIRSRLQAANVRREYPGGINCCKETFAKTIQEYDYRIDRFFMLINV
jgi:hypothetical protein